MEGLYKAVVTLPYQSGLPEDSANNTLYFLAINAANTQQDDIDEMQGRLVSFFNDIPPGEAKSISDYIGDQVSRSANACVNSYYFEAAIAPPAQWGSPVGTASWTIGIDDNFTVQPAEVAAVLTFHGDLTDIPQTAVNPTPPPAVIRPAARRRGRIYLGPLHASAGAAGGPNADLLVSTAFQDVVLAAATELENTNVNLQWVVASDTAGEVYQVVGGWMDNAFDTQRRRGSAATVRTLWP